jgi:FkbM family methyltransferase
MNDRLKQVILPNKMKVYCSNKREARIVYEQVQEYLRNGIALKEGDVVFDVGANIGIFSLYVNYLLKQRVEIYAFEPIPAIYSILQRNADLFNRERIHTFCCGISQYRNVVTFDYYPNLSILSTAYSSDPLAASRDMQNTILRNLNGAPPDIRLLRFVPRFLRPPVLNWLLRDAFKIEPAICQMTTISQIIDEFKLERIDLLKIDVEKAELDVLLGIECGDWQKIEQLAIEVHDLNGRLKTIEDLLQNYGFSQITIEQEPFFTGTEIYNLYAAR